MATNCVCALPALFHYFFFAKLCLKIAFLQILLLGNSTTKRVSWMLLRVLFPRLSNFLNFLRIFLKCENYSKASFKFHFGNSLTIFLGQFIWVLKVLKVWGLTWSHKIFYSKGTYTKTIKTVVFYDLSLKDAFCFFLAKVTFELSLCVPHYISYCF